MNLVINIQKIKRCFNNNNKRLECVALFGHTSGFYCIIIIKTPFYLLKINKRTNKNISVTHFY